jgi:hypothetical protein
MSVTTPPSDSPSANSSELICLWKQCHLKFEEPELLYHHLSNDHVGRKATGNLCLECHWEKCEVKTGKRDHITSHLRVHVPLKPHSCETCNKAFKRRQDLKKHEKIHTEQHQQLISDHKHQRLQKTSHPQTPPQYPRSDRSPSVCSSIESQSSFPLSPNRVVPGFGFNTTPPHDNNYDNYDVYSNYDNYDISNPTVIPEFSNYNNVKRPDVSANNTFVPASNKRGIEAVEEFYLDVKRKRVDPVYNQGKLTVRRNSKNCL